MITPFIALGLAILIVATLILGGLIILGLIGRAIANNEDECSQDGERLDGES